MKTDWVKCVIVGWPILLPHECAQPQWAPTLEAQPFRCDDENLDLRWGRQPDSKPPTYHQTCAE